MNAQLEPITRKPSDWLTTAQIRAMLKNNLGLNSRQVTVSKRHSQQYLDITIRDAAVAVAKVQEFAKSLSTWTMDNTDYCSGQSINVSTTGEVDAIHAAPFLEEIKRVIPTMAPGETHGLGLSNGSVLWLGGHQGFYIGREQERGSYISEHDARAGKDWAIQALALQMAKI